MPDDEQQPPRLALQKAGAVITLAAAVALALIAIDVLRQRPEQPPADDAQE
jgi:hypothetical protein